MICNSTPAAGGGRRKKRKMESIISFVAGASYGAMSVVVGQPLDTVKTRMQAHSANLNANPFVTATTLFKKEGIRGLYRGGTPIFVGGALFRSAQFGFYEAAMKFSKGRIPEDRYFGFLNPQVVVSGFCGGIARGLVRPCMHFHQMYLIRQCRMMTYALTIGGGTLRVHQGVKAGWQNMAVPQYVQRECHDCISQRLPFLLFRDLH